MLEIIEHGALCSRHYPRDEVSNKPAVVLIGVGAKTLEKDAEIS